MLCYFLRDGHLAGVEMLPLGLSDEDAIARAHTLSSKRKGPFDGFEVWDRARFVFRLPVARVEAAQPGVPDPWAMIFQRVVMMSEHADHRFSATLSSPDSASIGCLQALANFGEQTGNDTVACEDTKGKDWRAVGQKATFRFSRALDRDLFKNEVRRLFARAARAL
jgi:hypothetical protein